MWLGRRGVGRVGGRAAEAGRGGSVPAGHRAALAWVCLGRNFKIELPLQTLSWLRGRLAELCMRLQVVLDPASKSAGSRQAGRLQLCLVDKPPSLRLISGLSGSIGPLH